MENKQEILKKNEMAENEILPSCNIPSRDSDYILNNLTSQNLESSSSTEFNECLTKVEDVKSCKTISNTSNDSLSDKFSPFQTDLNISKKDTDIDTDNDAGNENCGTYFDPTLNNKDAGNQVSIPNAESESVYDNMMENVNKALVLNKEIAAVDELGTSNSEDSGISLMDEKKIDYHQENGNAEIQPIDHVKLPETDLEIPSNVTNVVDIVRENMNKANETCEAKTNSDILDMIFPRVSDKEVEEEEEEEEAIFNRDNELQQTSLQNLPDSEENLERTENEIDENDSVKAEVTIPNCENLVRSKSVAELSTAYTNKPNSLAEDAKLVKFSVSTKSVNIMQSNAQFLNKSRNFLNFITEKSTNIMEKTLLPQNLTAKYNSILKLAENTPGNYKKFIGETGSASNYMGSHLQNNCEISHRIVHDEKKYNSQDTDTSNSHHREHENIPDNYNHQDGPMKQDQKLFFEHLPNGNQADPVLTPKAEEMETVSNSEGKINPSDFGTGENRNTIELSTMSDSSSSEKILTTMPKENSEFLCRDNNADSMLMMEKNQIQKNEVDNVATSLTNASNAVILPSSETVLIEDSDQEQIRNEDVDSRKSKDELIDLGLLAHPAYIALLRDYTNLKEKSEKLLEAKVKGEMENQRLAAENNGEVYALQLETLERTIEQLKLDLKQATASQELINKEFLLANREKESMVMKYAMSEKQLIDTQRAREYAERKVNEALREQELLHTKLKQVQGERTRICNILDGKCHELTDAQKEVDRLKEELSMREVKLKWTQNKLKTELETQRENQQKLDKALLRINEMKEECEQVRKESQETIRKFQQSEENKVVTLDHQLKEQQARLILERHVTEDKELSRLQLQREVETLKQRQHALIEENNTLSLKVQNLEKERLNYENNLSNLKVIADQRQKEIVDLAGKVSQLETLKLQLKHKEQLLSSNEAEVERLRQSNTELQSDMEWCREREAHMLEFTQKLTDKNVRLQSEFTAMEAKNEQLELEQGPLHDEIKELSAKVKSLEISLASEKSKRTEECELLARHVAEQTQLARNLAKKLEDSQGENAVLRRKQQISVKEMTKELQQCKKRLDAFETGSPSNSLDRTSRTGSSSSLSTGETLNGAVSDNSNSGDHILQSVEPDRQTLIDRIVKLQRIRVRQAEKLDFLEEHTRTLVNELQKKTKIIKNYIFHENSDAMASNERDRNKAELARHGGIMASVYNQRVSDDNMTLELSLEINQKLQAVLEDTLLKNITLKDSIDTLGGEIARLTMQNKRRQ